MFTEDVTPLGGNNTAVEHQALDSKIVGSNPDAGIRREALSPAGANLKKLFTSVIYDFFVISSSFVPGKPSTAKSNVCG